MRALRYDQSDEMWRSVVRYCDQGDDAFDELACGHIVRCSRKAGGRVVVGHQEPCKTCRATERRIAPEDPGATPGWRP